VWTGERVACCETLSAFGATFAEVRVDRDDVNFEMLLLQSGSNDVETYEKPGHNFNESSDDLQPAYKNALSLACMTAGSYSRLSRLSGLLFLPHQAYVVSKPLRRRTVFTAFSVELRGSDA
jgi:hypothetical protein